MKNSTQSARRIALALAGALCAASHASAAAPVGCAVRHVRTPVRDNRTRYRFFHFNNVTNGNEQL